MCTCFYSNKALFFPQAFKYNNSMHLGPCYFDIWYRKITCLFMENYGTFVHISWEVILSNVKTDPYLIWTIYIWWYTLCLCLRYTVHSYLMILPPSIPMVTISINKCDKSSGCSERTYSIFRMWSPAIMWETWERWLTYWREITVSYRSSLRVLSHSVPVQR